MHRIAVAVGLALLCSAAHAQSPFAGAWRGTWSDPNGQFGSAIIAIDPAGGITGTVANRSLSVIGPIMGRTNEFGRTHLTYTYDGGRSYYAADGTMFRTDDQLVGRFAIHTAGGRSLGIDTFRFTGPHAAPPGMSRAPETPDDLLPSPKQQ